MIHKILLFSIIILQSINVYASDDPVEKEDLGGRYRIGGNLGVFQVWNKTSIPVFDNDAGCGTFSNGTRDSFYAGLNFGYNIIDDFLVADVRALYEERAVFLETTTACSEYLNKITNKYEPFVRLHTYDAKLQYVAFDFGAKIKPFYYVDGFSHLPIYFRLGFEAGQPLFSTNYVNTEEIVSPETALFPDDTKKHIVGQGAISDAGTAYGASFSLLADFRLRSGMIITPEISYRFGLNSIVSSSDWFADILRIGFGVSWEFGADKPEPEPEPEIEIAKPEKEIIIKKTPAITSLTSGGLSITETVVTQTYPLLPYVFFDSASADLRTVYKNADLTAENSATYQLPKSTLAIYYHFLDIVGMRLTGNPDADITITGMTDGKELPAAGKRLEIAKYRAVAVADYLHDKWGIARDRMKIKNMDTPRLATSSEYREGFQENRRVEIASNNSDILKPIVHSKFVEFHANKTELIFKTEIEDAADVESWSFSLDLPETAMIYFEENGRPSKNIKVGLNQNQINRIGNEILKNNKNKNDVNKNNVNKNKNNVNKNKNKNNANKNIVSATLKIRSKDGRLVEKTVAIDIKRNRNNFEIGRLNLIVFDFDRSEISNQNKQMISEFIKAAIKQSSKSNITGSTDRLGEMEYNQSLSLDRAKSVERYLRRIMPEINIESVKGIGASNLKYDNNLPEGRFYCRTVLIEVKTPLKSN